MEPAYPLMGARVDSVGLVLLPPATPKVVEAEQKVLLLVVLRLELPEPPTTAMSCGTAEPGISVLPEQRVSVAEAAGPVERDRRVIVPLPPREPWQSPEGITAEMAVQPIT